MSVAARDGSVPVERGTFRSFDGTRIAYQKVGQGPWIVLANGLGGTFEAWRPVYEALADSYTVLCWDYRGLYDSGPPPDQAAVTLAHQVRDLEALLAHHGVQRAVFLGWSMGTQVNLEFYRHHPEMYEGLVFLNGTYGRPFETAFGRRFMATVIPLLLKAMEAGAPVLPAVLRPVAGQPWLVPLLQGLGLVGRTLDREIFAQVAERFAALDFRLYARTLMALGEHDAWDVLATVSCPTLVVTGERDLMTPAETGKEICSRVRDCRLVLLPAASHYAAIEYPDEVVALLLEFLDELGYGRER